MHLGREKIKVFIYVFIFFPGGQSDHGYDSLSKEEERMCLREGDNLTLMDDKGPRLLCEL